MRLRRAKAAAPTPLETRDVLGPRNIDERHGERDIYSMVLTRYSKSSAMDLTHAAARRLSDERQSRLWVESVRDIAAGMAPL